MDDFRAPKTAVVFDWQGTLAVRDYSSDSREEKPIDGLAEFISELRQQRIDLFIATGGNGDPSMVEVGFDNREILYSSSGYKGIEIDRLRAKGYERIVYVGDCDHDVENPATREIPVIIFEPKEYSGKSKERMAVYRAEQMDKIRELIDGVDITDANGLGELKLAIAAAIERAHLPTANKTQIRAFGSNNYAIEIGKRFVELLREAIEKPIIDRTGEDNVVANVPDERCVVVATSSFPNGRQESFQIDVDYPLDVPQARISEVVEIITNEMRAQGVFGPYAGLQTITRYPDSARPQVGRDLD